MPPAVLLKIYIYGYLNRIQSSRRLEREAQRNVELMWLTGRLMHTGQVRAAAPFVTRQEAGPMSLLCDGARSRVRQWRCRGAREWPVQGRTIAAGKSFQTRLVFRQFQERLIQRIPLRRRLENTTDRRPGIRHRTLLHSYCQRRTSVPRCHPNQRSVGPCWLYSRYKRSRSR
jgi:hypothetical protein